MSQQASTVFGIDLGTTYSCIAYIDEYGKPSTIPNAEGDRTTPSVIYFEGQNRVVGKEAKNVAVLHPDQVVEMVKRQMGKRDWIFVYDGTEYSAEEISSYILRKLVSDAATSLGTKITDVVITCPAYFGINEREATAKAGEIAGLNVRSIINEPTAAAIAYGLHEDKDQTVLVYDLGGGTFDITMIDIKGKEINVIATGGDHNLGGRNWDEIVVNYLAEQWKSITGLSEDPLDDMETTQDLFLRAEQAKISLSAKEKTEVAVTHAGRREKVTLTREKFDELTANLLERTIEYTRSMLKEAEKKGYTRFDQILLVGGSSRMLQVPERLRKEFNVESRLTDPDEAVAKGAAWYGQKLAIGDMIKTKIDSWGGKETTETAKRAQQEVADEMGMTLPSVQGYLARKFTNVTSRSFGVVALDEKRKEGVSNLILVNTSLPASATQRFGTVDANQENVEIRIMETTNPAERVEVSDCDEIGNGMLPLPSGLPANAPIEITFTLDEQGRLHGLAKELSANRTLDFNIETKRVISKEKLEEAKARSKQIMVS
jgi:molecular chaperone DnaK (HSP70)